MKNIFCIRHGKAHHNVLNDQIGEKAYFLEECFDAPLVNEGLKQAKKLSKNFLQLNEIEIVYVSSLTRTIQTAESIFIDREKIKIIALDKIKEFPQGKEICNKRRSKSVLKSKFLRTDFSELDSDLDKMWRADRFEKQNELQKRVSDFKIFLKSVNYQNIAIISHNEFLKELLFGRKNSESHDLEHCHPYKLDLSY